MCCHFPVRHEILELDLFRNFGAIGLSLCQWSGGDQVRNYFVGGLDFRWFLRSCIQAREKSQPQNDRNVREKRSDAGLKDTGPGLARMPIQQQVGTCIDRRRSRVRYGHRVM